MLSTDISCRSHALLESNKLKTISKEILQTDLLSTCLNKNDRMSVVNDKELFWTLFCRSYCAVYRHGENSTENAQKDTSFVVSYLPNKNLKVDGSKEKYKELKKGIEKIRQILVSELPKGLNFALIFPRVVEDEEHDGIGVCLDEGGEERERISQDHKIIFEKETYLNYIKKPLRDQFKLLKLTVYRSNVHKVIHYGQIGLGVNVPVLYIENSIAPITRENPQNLPLLVTQNTSKLKNHLWAFWQELFQLSLSGLNNFLEYVTDQKLLSGFTVAIKTLRIFHAHTSIFALAFCGKTNITKLVKHVTRLVDIQKQMGNVKHRRNNLEKSPNILEEIIDAEISTIKQKRKKTIICIVERILRLLENLTSLVVGISKILIVSGIVFSATATLAMSSLGIAGLILFTSVTVLKAGNYLYVNRNKIRNYLETHYYLIQEKCLIYIRDKKKLREDKALSIFNNFTSDGTEEANAKKVELQKEYKAIQQNRYIYSSRVAGLHSRVYKRLAQERKDFEISRKFYHQCPKKLQVLRDSLTKALKIKSVKEGIRIYFYQQHIYVKSNCVADDLIACIAK